MKYFILIIAFFSVNAFSQPNSNKSLLNSALKEYASLNQAFHLNRKCKILNAKKTEIFSKNYTRISIQMHNDIRNIDLLTKVEEAGKKSSDLVVLKSCGSKAVKIVDNAYSHSVNWIAHIDKIKNTPKTKKSDPLINYGTLYGAWGMNQNCNILSKQEKSDFDLSMRAIHRLLTKEKLLNDQKYNKLKEQYGYIAKKEPFSSCGAVAKNAIINSKNTAINWANKIVENGGS